MPRGKWVGVGSWRLNGLFLTGVGLGENDAATTTPSHSITLW